MAARRAPGATRKSTTVERRAGRAAPASRKAGGNRGRLTSAQRAAVSQGLRSKATSNATFLSRGVVIALEYYEGTEGHWQSHRCVAGIAGSSTGDDQKVWRRGAGRLLKPAQKDELARIGAAAGHPHRVAILQTLLLGPASFSALTDAVGLKAGPLYHHVRQLREAGLVAPKSRDVYRLTCAGRNLLLLFAAAHVLLTDRGTFA